MKEIPLSRGQVAIVDDADYDYLMQWSWHADKRSDGNGYYVSTKVRVGGKQQTVYMHGLLLGVAPGERGDHRDGNGLHNWRSNLRKASAAQNQYNKRKLKTKTSLFKGVYFFKRDDKWRAQINFNGKSIHLGLFNDEASAARAYDTAAGQLFKEFVRTNF